MSDPWRVIYYKDSKGDRPVKNFFELPSSIGITEGEKKMFEQRLSWVEAKGLPFARERPDVLEPLKSEDNLYSLRVRSKPNNSRVLLCAVPGTRLLVLLHAFKEKSTKDYTRAIKVARTRRDQVLAAPSKRQKR